MFAERKLYILCGGKSRRMGTDKALLDFKGRSFLERLCQRGKPHFKEIILLSGSNTYPTDHRQIQDVLPGVGPLGGLLSALRDAAHETQIAILSIDVPKVSEQTLKLMAQTSPEAGTDALLARAGGVIQPLAGIYQTRLSDSLASYLDHGERRVMGFLKEVNLGFFNVAAEEIDNINTPEDYNSLHD